jgi:hypothetical protein
MHNPHVSERAKEHAKEMVEGEAEGEQQAATQEEEGKDPEAVARGLKA